MKIELNEDIRGFLSRTTDNIINKTDSPEIIKIDSYNEKEVIREMQKHDENIKDVFIDIKLMTENPYYKNINLSNINKGGFRFTNEFLPKRTALSISWLLPDKKRELEDYNIYGCFKKSINIPMLREGNDIWMSPTLAEQNTINPCIDKAFGNVLTFGLGIGYFPYMCSLKDNVKSITIVELNKNVIDMFKECILPQFNTDIEINIIHGNMFDYFNEEFLNKFDYTFVDVWKNNDDGLNILEKLFEQLNYKGNIDYWIEFSCYMTFKMLMFLYFKSLANNNLSELLSDFKGEDKRQLTKIHRYFREKDITITSSEELKDYLYNIELIREILSIKL